MVFLKLRTLIVYCWLIRKPPTSAYSTGVMHPYPCLLVNLYHYRQFVFNKGTRQIQWGNNGLFKLWWWNYYISTNNKMNLGPYFPTYINIISKCIQKSNCKRIDYKHVSKSLRQWSRQRLARYDTKRLTLKENSWKLDSSKIKTFCFIGH